MAFSLTKRMMYEEESEGVTGGASLRYQPKRMTPQSGYTFNRISNFPRIELTTDELIESTGKTTFTINEVKQLVTTSNLINERRMRDEYEQILSTKLKEQFESFSTYQRDYVAKQYGENESSYIM
ncbi:hypothetical protein EIN_425410 [Entamoeba invadens IP1]|uniref:Akirin n=1 Tax=Entamoeba invadens IP1 TaxID=370355 RepID=A0A0A1UBY3_ENTIV|nr:hypothetical protein EIN_425410 [Entamoeba invadens IP1]ELP89809.1 hypothetical protein EIN_425410 [Entamoeba invadens IP1]|eukprot:XP_004256580.1 hypothetical protein EIN_425410 [Entamoeba invadens IP1]